MKNTEHDLEQRIRRAGVLAGDRAILEIHYLEMIKKHSNLYIENFPGPVLDPLGIYNK